MHRLLGIASVLSLALIGCATAPAVAQNPKPTEFRTQTIRLYGHQITAEIAGNQEQRERGLMGRTQLADGYGMLFVFEQDLTLRFWMKNTLIPLSIGYFSADKTLIDILEMTPAAVGDERPPTYASSKPVRYALEMPKGWFARKKIPLGAKLVYVNKHN